MLIPASARRAQMSPSGPGWSSMSTVRQSSIDAYRPSFCRASRPLAGSSQMIFARPSNTARARMFTLALPSAWATSARVPGLLASWTVSCLPRGMTLPPGELPAQPQERIVVAIDHPLFEGDDSVVRDLDLLRADVGAAARDVAETGAEILPDGGDPIPGVQRMHLERRQPDHEPRPHERILAGPVAQNVTDVLAEIALDALAELLDPVDIALHHAIRPVGGPGRWPERGDATVLLVVPGDVGDEILDDRKRLQRLDRDRLARRELVHACHAGEPGPAVDLHAARAALARLAVPPDRQILRESRLDAVQHVQDDHARIDLDAVLDERASRRRSPPEAKLALRHVR